MFAVVREKYGADTLRSAISEINLALLLRDADELEAAETHARSALKHARVALGPDSPRIVGIMRMTASVLTRKGRLGESGTLLDRAYAILSHSEGFDATHPLLQDIVRDYVDLYTAMKRPDLAQKWRDRAAPVAAADGS